MCGSNRVSRNAALVAAAAFYATTAAAQVESTKGPGEVESKVQFFLEMGGRADTIPAHVNTFLPIERAYLDAVREVNEAQIELVSTVLRRSAHEGALGTFPNTDAEVLGAALNNLATAEQAWKDGRVAYNAVQDELEAQSGVQIEPVTLQ